MRLWILPLVLAVGSSEAAPDAATQQHALVAQSSDQVGLANQLERKAKAEWTGEVAPAAIQWSEANGHASAPDALNSTQRDAIASTTLPVLLPSDPLMLSSAAFTTGDLWYSAAMRTTGAHTFIMGSRGEFPVDLGLTEAQKQQLSNFTVYRTHQIVTLSFRMYGAAYRIDVECDKPMDDPRCTQDDYVLELAEGLVMVGGQP